MLSLPFVRTLYFDIGNILGYGNNEQYRHIYVYSTVIIIIII